MQKGSVFFAYQSANKSADKNNVDAIREAVKFINKSCMYKLVSWEDMCINGRVMIKAICEEIDKCDIFACDLTYLNHNVLFEFGYAIAKGKRLLILMNPNVPHSTDNYAKIDILKGIAYAVFINSNDIYNALKKVPETPQLLSDFSLDNEIVSRYDVFYFSSTLNSQAEINIKKVLNRYKLKTDYIDFARYNSAYQCLKSVLSSDCTIVHMTDVNFDDSKVVNAKASLLSGICFGLGKKILLLSPDSYIPPIDYFNLMVKYNNAIDCGKKLASWIRKYLKPSTCEDKRSNLVGKLIDDNKCDDKQSVGDSCEVDIEADQLAHYDDICLGHDVYTNKPVYLPISSLSGNMLISGISGSGKTVFTHNLMRELTDNCIPFYIIETKLNEYRRISIGKGHIRAISLFSHEAKTLSWNPFTPPIGSTLDEYFDYLVLAFQIGFSLTSTSNLILKSALQMCYEECGWKGHNKHGDENIEQFDVSILKRAIEKLTVNYSNSIEDEYDVWCSLVLRLSMMYKLYDSDAFTKYDNEPLNEEPTVIDLSAIHDKELLTFVSVLVLFRILLTKNERMQHKKINRIVFLNEVNCLFNDSQSGLTELMQKISDFETSGTGIIFSCQTSETIRALAKNIKTRVVFRTFDRDEVANAIEVDAKEALQLSRLKVGEAYAYSYQLLKPKRIFIPYNKDWNM